MANRDDTELPTHSGVKVSAEEAAEHHGHVHIAVGDLSTGTATKFGMYGIGQESGSGSTGFSPAGVSFTMPEQSRREKVKAVKRRYRNRKRWVGHVKGKFPHA